MLGIRGRRHSRALGAGLTAAAATWMLAAGIQAPGAGAVSGPDLAATRSYLGAALTYEEQIVAHAAASRAALAGVAAAVGRECRDVLRGAPCLFANEGPPGRSSLPFTLRESTECPPMNGPSSTGS